MNIEQHEMTFDQIKSFIIEKCDNDIFFANDFDIDENDDINECIETMFDLLRDINISMFDELKRYNFNIDVDFRVVKFDDEYSLNIATHVVEYACAMYHDDTMRFRYEQMMRDFDDCAHDACHALHTLINVLRATTR